MSDRVLIYTAICSGYDDLITQPPQTIPCDFVCFTDEPGRLAAGPWRVIPLARAQGTARQRAKFPKILPHEALSGELAGGEPYDFTIWIDGSIRILRSTFAEQFVAAARSTGLALVPHPARDCIYDEVAVSLGPDTAHKYRGQRLDEQIEHYRAEGYPAHLGLFACGLIARSMSSRVVRVVDEAWWAEIVRWSFQDQLSLPYVLWKAGASHGLLDVNLWKNRLFEVVPHADLINGELFRRARPEYSAVPFAETPMGDSLGVYMAESGTWHLRPYASEADTAFAFGPGGQGLLPLSGDWDGDGLDSPGLYDPGTGSFFLRNSCDAGQADVVFTFGPPGATPITGDWDGDGRDSVGVFLPDSGGWALTNRNEPGSAEIEFSFGPAPTAMIPVTGDWDGRGRDLVGFFDPVHGNWFLARELVTGAEADVFDFGFSGGIPVVGDWDGDGADEVGVYVPEQGRVLLTEKNRSSSRCFELLLDPPNAKPIAGRWSRLPASDSGPERVSDLRNYSSTGVPERILPEDLAAAPDHLARYLFAAHWAAGRRVLDLCCGVGYGSQMLSAAGARLVYGVDVDEEVIRYARQRFGSPGVEFLRADATSDMTIPEVDLVVCFEGLEHVAAPEKLLRNVVDALGASGLFIVSTPNGSHYPGGFSGNPHHMKEYTRATLEALLSQHFRRVDMHSQTIEPVDAVGHGAHAAGAYAMRPLPHADPERVPRPESAPFVWVAVCHEPIR